MSAINIQIGNGAYASGILCIAVGDGAVARGFCQVVVTSQLTFPTNITTDNLVELENQVNDIKLTYQAMDDKFVLPGFKMRAESATAVLLDCVRRQKELLASLSKESKEKEEANVMVPVVEASATSASTTSAGVD